MRRLPGLNDLRVFETAARLQSFRRAAEALHLTHGAVSHRVRAIEEQLGITLFDRQDRMRLMPAGRELSLAATTAIALLSNAIDGIDRASAQRPEALRISLDSMFAARFLMPRWRRAAMEPSQQAILLDTSTEQGHAARPGCELGICYSSAMPDGHRAELLMTDCFYPVAAPALCQQLNSQHPSSAGLALISAAPPHGEEAGWRALAAVLSSTVAPTLSVVDEGELALRAAEQGYGVAIARHSMVRESIRAGQLQRVGNAGFLARGGYYLIRATDQPGSAAALAFSAWLRTECRQLVSERDAELAGMRWVGDEISPQR